jgi:hypothetical protein
MKVKNGLLVGRLRSLFSENYCREGSIEHGDLPFFEKRCDGFAENGYDGAKIEDKE